MNKTIYDRLAISMELIVGLMLVGSALFPGNAPALAGKAPANHVLQIIDFSPKQLDIPNKNINKPGVLMDSYNSFQPGKRAFWELGIHDMLPL